MSTRQFITASAAISFKLVSAGHWVSAKEPPAPGAPLEPAIEPVQALQQRYDSGEIGRVCQSLTSTKNKWQKVASIKTCLERAYNCKLAEKRKEYVNMPQQFRIFCSAALFK